MHSVHHEHLLPIAGICLGGDGGLKIVTLLRPLGSLLRFFEQYSSQLGSKQLMLYCYQVIFYKIFLKLYIFRFPQQWNICQNVQLFIVIWLLEMF